jgi:hypothetical protein
VFVTNKTELPLSGCPQLDWVQVLGLEHAGDSECEKVLHVLARFQILQRHTLLSVFAVKTTSASVCRDWSK